MKIIVAKNIGLCTGAKRAIDIAWYSLEKSQKPVQFLGEILHNEKVINEFKRKGGKFVSSPEKAKTGTLIIRAHGAPPFSFSKNILVKDATCFLVKKVQDAAKDLFKKGYKVIIIGEKNHPEIIGIQGHINNKGIVIEDEFRAKLLKKYGKIGVLSQTTQNLEKVNEIIKILKEKTRKLEWINTLCPQVLLRQKEVSEIIKKTDGVLVIGSPTSANTKRLAEMVKKERKPVLLTNFANSLKKKMFKGISVLGVVSGTSTPDWIVKKIIKKLKTFK